jgi:hypothetical protein
MQVNLMHHPYAFATLDDAFDPAHNAAYAGRFLMELFASSGDWGTAIAAYHSRTPGVGEPYRDQVVATWNPTDPAVLAKLSFQPLPPLPTPISGGSGAIYAPFAQPGPIQIAPNMAYRAFLPTSSVYGAFRPASTVYGDFAQRPVRRQIRRRPMDFRVNLGLSGRALVVPTGVVVSGHEKFVDMKPTPKRHGDSG